MFVYLIFATYNQSLKLILQGAMLKAMKTFMIQDVRYRENTFKTLIAERKMVKANPPLSVPVTYSFVCIINQHFSRLQLLIVIDGTT